MNEIEQKQVKALTSALGVSERFAELLVRRGFSDPEKAKKFLFPSVDQMEDPLLLTGMEQAVQRIRTALENQEKIVVYGDFDCDGICAVSILYDYLRSRGADVSYFIPNRFEDGYGLSIECLEEIAETLFPDLIITVDCGVCSVKEAAFLDEELGIDLIVTDHHNLPDVLPQAIIVNPKSDVGLASHFLCGAGVAYKLVQALGGQEDAWKYVELAAIATVGDVVPLIGENRLITKLGLDKIRSRESINKGLRILLEAVGLARTGITSSSVAFSVVPRINAIGRLGDCSEVVSLFTDEEYVTLKGLVEKMDHVNELRKSIVDETKNEALEMMKEYDLVTHKVIMLYKQDWNAGILGLVATRLKTMFSRPAILLCGKDVLRGSSRAPEGADMTAILKSAESVLVQFGGHKGAAGLSVKQENVIQARNMMDAFVEKTYPNDLFSRKENYDLILSPEEITLSLVNEVEMLEPTGEGNRKPLFLFKSEDCPLAPFGSGDHVRCRFGSEGEIVGFNLSHLAEGMQMGGKYDLLCELSRNEFKNVEKAQMRILSVFPREFAPSDKDPELFHRYLRTFFAKEQGGEIAPVTAKECNDVLYDDDFCTLFVAFSQSGATLLKEKPFADKVKKIAYSINEDSPWNSLLYAPSEDPVAYRRIVLLDTPLGKGYPSKLAKASGGEVVVVTDNYPFLDVFRAADLSAQAINATYQKITSFLFKGGAATSPMDLMRKIEPDDLSFLIRFYVLYELGSLSIGKGFAISPQSLRDPNASMLYRRACALKLL